MEFDNVLEEVLNDGILIDDSEEYEPYHSDCVGGEYKRLKIIKYNDKFYAVKEKVEINHKLEETKECVAFYELK